MSQFFISYTIRNFGALTFATIMTTRQVQYKSPHKCFILLHLCLKNYCSDGCYLLNLSLLMKLVSIMLSCVWFAHPLSWEQWIGAVSINMNLFTHPFIYHIFEVQQH